MNGWQPVVTRAVRRCGRGAEITHPQGSGQRALGGYALGFCSADAVCGESAWHSEELGAAVQRVEMLLCRGDVACLCRGRRVVHPWEWLCTVVCIGVLWECAALRVIVGYGLQMPRLFPGIRGVVWRLVASVKYCKHGRMML